MYIDRLTLKNVSLITKLLQKFFLFLSWINLEKPTSVVSADCFNPL